MTNKRISELVQATQVDDSDELVVVQSGTTKRVQKSILQDSLSVESGTTINHETLGTIDNLKLADVDTGNSAVAGASGILQGTLGFETVIPIRGKQSLKYENNATAELSDNDWVLKTINIPSGYSERIHEFNFQFKNTYKSGSVRAKIIVSGSTEPLVDEILISTDDALEFSRRFDMRGNSSLQWGFQIVSGEIDGVLQLDDVQITPNLREVQESVFVEKEDSAVQVSGSLTSVDFRARFPTLNEKVGSAITYSDDGTDGTVATIEEDGLYTVNATMGKTSFSLDFSIQLNGVTTTNTNTGTSQPEMLAYETVSAGFLATASWSGYLRKGDKLAVQQSNNSSAGTFGLHHRFNISKNGSARAFPAFKDQKVEIPTSELQFSGVTSKGTGGEAYTLKYDVVEKQSGSALSYANSNGTVVIIKKRGVLSVSASAYTGGSLYISKNASNPANEPTSEEIQASHSPGTGAARQNLSTSFDVEVGDTIRIVNNSTVTVDAQSVLRITHLETEVSVSVNNVVPQYEEIDSMIRLNTTNGRGAVNIAIRRFSNLVEQSGKSVVYADSANDGASFTIQEDGVYSISYTDLFGTSARLGISVNSNQLTSDISSVNNSNVLASTLTGSGNWTENVSWTGKLSAGDVIRPHCNTAADNTSNAEGHFTITKQSKPSIIGIDGRPLDAYQQKSDSYIRLYPMTGSDQFVNWGGVQDIKGSAISFQNSNEIVINEDGIYHFSGTVYMAGGSTPNIAFLKNTTVFTDSAVTPNMLYLSTHSDTTAQYDLVAFTAKLEAGDIVRGIGSTSIVPVGVNTFFTVSKIGSLIRSIPLIDSTVDIPTSIISLKGATGLGSGSESQVIQYNNISKISGEGLTLDNSNGTKVVVQKRGVVSILGDAIMGSNGTIRITINNSDRTNANPTGNYVVSQSSESAGFHNQVSAVLKVEAGDEIHIIANNGVSVEASSNLTVLHQETEVAVALSNVTPQFEDVDSMIRVTTANGYGSAGTKITRYSGVEQIKGAAVTYQDSVTNGASFTINESGVYGITVVGSNSVGAGIVGVSRNASSLTTEIYGLPSNERLVEQETETAGYRISASGTFYLEAGDIIRPHNAGAAQNNNPEHSFTIVKQALPSIAEVDITPFADFNTNEWKTNSVRASGNNGEVVGAGATTPFSNAQGDGWSSNEYTVQQNNSIIELSFGTLFTGSFGRSYDLYLNGSVYKRINQLVTNDQHAGSYISSRGEFDAGDVLTIRLAQGSGTLSNNPAYHYLVINEHYIEEVYERVYAIEDNENVFSARIKNNDSPADTASITSQSSEFIQSVNRSGEGIVDVTFVPGFFTEIPSVNATIEGTIDNTDVSESVRNLSVNGFRFITEYNPTGVGVDFSFSFTVQRQGSDYKDLQRQIVSLKEFPKVNNLLSQELTWSSSSANILEGTTYVRFGLSEFQYGGDSIIEAVDNPTDTRTDFVALKDCKVNVNFVASITNIGHNFNLRKNDVIFSRGETTVSASYPSTVYGSTLLKKGDVLTVYVTDSISSDAIVLNIVAQAQELKSVGNLSGGENVFSAKIQNNGVATVLSENTAFIQSVNRDSLGKVTINWVPGFFTATPAIFAFLDDGVTTSITPSIITSPTISSVQLEFYNDDAAAYQDRDFFISVQRQGSDYRDAQEQIIQLEDFPRVNRTIVEAYRADTAAGYGSTNTKIPYFTNVNKNSINSLGNINSNSTDGLSFTASKKCSVTATYNFSSSSVNAYFGFTLNSTQLTTDIVSITGSDIVALSAGTSANVVDSVSCTVDMEIGDVLRPHTDSAATSNNNLHSIHFVVKAQELERVDNIDAVENVLSANLFLGAGSQSIESTNVDFIDSIARNATGNYTINYKPGFFTVAPAVTLSGYHHGGVISAGTISYIAHNENSMSIYINNTQGVDYDPEETVCFTAVKQGVDYKSIQDIVVALPESKTRWQKKTLGAATSAVGVISDFTFNNLVVGNHYKLHGSIKISATDFSSNAKRYSATIDNGATNLVDLEVASSNVFEYKNTIGISEVFIATATTVTFTCSLANLTQLSGGAHLVLEELPLHEQTSDWT